MKTRSYVWICVAALLSLAACIREDMESHPQAKEVELTIIIQGTTVDTRGTGANLPADDNDGEKKINRLAIAIFDGSGNVTTIQEFTPTTGSSNYKLKCKAGTGYSGIVVTNAPANHFAGITKKTDFEAKTVDLAQTSDNLVMSGAMKANTSETFELSSTGENKLTVNVSRLVARVAINSIKTGFDASGPYKSATFTAKKIFLHNANTKSTVKPASPTGSVPLSGKTDGENTGLQEALNNVSITGDAHTTPYWFYTFQHSATTPTKLVIYGSFDPDGTGAAEASNVYYPIVVNKFQAGTVINDGSTAITGAASGKGDATITPNSTYLISAIIKGKGVSSPDEDITPAALELTVTVEGWALNISQEVTFD